MTGKFAGWRGDFQGFFLGLQVNNTKAYFDAHRRQYEEVVKAPMVALIAELEPEFGPARLSRPNRDIRFAADKSPYKTNIYADARSGGYVSLDAASLVAAGGRYMLDGPELARFREAVAAEKSGAALDRIVGALNSRDAPATAADVALKLWATEVAASMWRRQSNDRSRSKN